MRRKGTVSGDRKQKIVRPGKSFLLNSLHGRPRLEPSAEDCFFFLVYIRRPAPRGPARQDFTFTFSLLAPFLLLLLRPPRGRPAPGPRPGGLPPASARPRGPQRAPPGPDPADARRRSQPHGPADERGRGFKDVVLRDVVLRTRGAVNGGLKAETLPRP